MTSVRLPSDTSAGGLHVFAIGFGGGTSVTGPIVSGVDASLCVDDDHGTATDNNPIQIWGCNSSGAQVWTVGTDGTLRVLGGCMDVTSSGTADGTKVQWYTCNGSGAQVSQPGSSGSLVNPQSGKCLDDPGSSTTAGTQLQIHTCNGSAAQRWVPP